MTSVTFYGGVDEIGGNKVLVEDYSTRIFLDFGKSFGKEKDYFSPFIGPRKCNGIGDYFELGLLFDIPGVYRQDYLRQMGRPKEERSIDAVLISHGHADHTGYLHHVRSDIPFWMSPATRAITASYEATAQPGFTDFLTYTENFTFRPKKTKKDEWMRTPSKESTTDRTVKTFEYGKKFKIGSIEVIPYEVDHSLPGATGFILHTTGGTIIYTGDLRFHGYKSDATTAFVKAAAEAKPDLLLTEGTRIGEERGNTEEDVRAMAGGAVKKTKSLAVANFPLRDLYRMVTFLSLAQDNGRKLAIDLKQAHLLQAMEEAGVDAPRLDDPSIAIYIPPKDWGLIAKDVSTQLCISKEDAFDIVRQDYSYWEQPFLSRGNVVKAADVRTNPSKYILFCSNYELKNLIDIKPPAGSSYLRSVTEPFDDEMEIEYTKMQNWVEHFKLPLYQFHSSGHAPGSDILGMVDAIAPRKVIPIHTMSPQSFTQKGVVRATLGQRYDIA